MKTTRVIYWTITGLVSAFMLMSSVPDVIRHPEAVAMINHLGYPEYFIPFIGTLKILGVIAILVPGFPKLREWAYAGLSFDLLGALYSHISVGDPVAMWSVPLVALLLLTVSYVLHRRKEESAAISF